MKWKIGTSLVVGVAVVSVGLSLFVTGYWSTEVSESTGAVAAVSESEGDGSHDGIKVYGEYEIEVRDPDGTLVAKRVVPNAVTMTGKNAIAKALMGEGGPSTWMIHFVSNPPPCPDSSCHLLLGSSTYKTNAPTQNTLIKSRNGNKINLSGTYLAGDPLGAYTGGSILGVAVYLSSGINATQRFSTGNLSSAVPYTMGQKINVSYTVTIN